MTKSKNNKKLNKHISFSKVLVFCLCLAFFMLLIFDAWVIIELMNFVRSGISLSNTAVIGTIASVMSTFASAVILFAVKGYLSKSGLENSVGYDAKTNTIAAERMGMTGGV